MIWNRDSVVARKVSVLITAYKHENFIAQAITSALMKRTTFDYEIVVGEDAPPDGILEVIPPLERGHPGNIRVLGREKDLGARNFTETFAACRGEYIAMLEGDHCRNNLDKLEVNPSAGFDRRGSAGAQLHSDVLGSPSARVDRELSGLAPEARLGGLAPDFACGRTSTCTANCAMRSATSTGV